MALTQEMSLGEARIEVLGRLGFTEQGTAVLRNVNLVDSWIRKGMRKLVHKAEWSSMFLELQIPLIVGQDRYDFPDETAIGQIQAFWVHDTNNRPWPMSGGLRWQDLEGDPSDETLRVKTGQPERWGIIDREIRIYPGPTETWTLLNMQYVARLPKLIEDTESLPFDSELIIRQAVLYGMVHYGMPGISEEKQDFNDYLTDIRKQQREGRVFTVGGRKSHFVTRPKETNGFRYRGNFRGRNAPYTPGWNPW
jgi:hypothetical protein